MTPWLTLVMNEPPARLLWKSTIGRAMVGFSNIRWWSKVECAIEIFRAFPSLGAYLTELKDEKIGDATTAKLLDIYENRGVELEIALAAMLDLERMVKATYDMEGDRLEILLVFRRLESLRQWGRSIGNAGSLPAVEAVVARFASPKVGMHFKKAWETTSSAGRKTTKQYKGSILSISSSIPIIYTVRYDIDHSTEEMSLEEVMNVLTEKLLDGDDLLQQARDGVTPVFEYLDDRLTGNCDAQYDCTATHLAFKLVQIFDPSWFRLHMEDDTIDWNDWITRLGDTLPTIEELVPTLKCQLPAYRTACSTYPIIPTGGIDLYTQRVLLFFQGLVGDPEQYSAWTDAALRVFSMSPNSASCERVFSLLKLMFSSMQMTALSDYVQGSLMLRYNGRDPG